MEWKGKEYGLELNIQSEIEISELCPDGDFAKIGEVLSSGTFIENVKNIIKIACMLSRGYEDHMKYDNPEYEVNYLTEDDFKFAKNSDIFMLTNAVTEAMSEGAEQTVETEVSKKKENQ